MHPWAAHSLNRNEWLWPEALATKRIFMTTPEAGGECFRNKYRTDITIFITALTASRPTVKNFPFQNHPLGRPWVRLPHQPTRQPNDIITRVR